VVIDDPDVLEEEDDEQGIAIYEPGAFIENTIEPSRLPNILFLVLVGWVLMLMIQVIIMIPMILAVGISNIYNLLVDPWALMISSVAEIGFILPPIWYVRKHGISIKSVGIKHLTSIRDAGLGLVFGVAMLGANIFISWAITVLMPWLDQGQGSIFYPPTDSSLFLWVGLWVFTMFVFVGFTEELMFRGFLQRRLEIMYRTKQSKNYKLIALVITSFIFAVVHLDLIGLPTRFVLGLFLGYLAQTRNYSLLGPTVAHGFNNSIIIILSIFVP
jgi:membrane protease YdiL (CAAX protease family)